MPGLFVKFPFSLEEAWRGFEQRILSSSSTGNNNGVFLSPISCGFYFYLASPHLLGAACAFRDIAAEKRGLAAVRDLLSREEKEKKAASISRSSGDSKNAVWDYAVRLTAVRRTYHTKPDEITIADTLKTLEEGTEHAIFIEQCTCIQRLSMFLAECFTCGVLQPFVWNRVLGSGFWNPILAWERYKNAGQLSTTTWSWSGWCSMLVPSQIPGSSDPASTSTSIITGKDLLLFGMNRTFFFHLICDIPVNVVLFVHRMLLQDRVFAKEEKQNFSEEEYEEIQNLGLWKKFTSEVAPHQRREFFKQQFYGTLLGVFSGAFGHAVSAYIYPAFVVGRSPYMCSALTFGFSFVFRMIGYWGRNRNQGFQQLWFTNLGGVAGFQGLANKRSFLELRWEIENFARYIGFVGTAKADAGKHVRLGTADKMQIVKPKTSSEAETTSTDVENVTEFIREGLDFSIDSNQLIVNIKTYADLAPDSVSPANAICEGFLAFQQQVLLSSKFFKILPRDDQHCLNSGTKKASTSNKSENDTDNIQEQQVLDDTTTSAKKKKDGAETISESKTKDNKSQPCCHRDLVLGALGHELMHWRNMDIFWLSVLDLAASAFQTFIPAFFMNAVSAEFFVFVAEKCFGFQVSNLQRSVCAGSCAENNFHRSPLLAQLLLAFTKRLFPADKFVECVKHGMTRVFEERADWDGESAIARWQHETQHLRHLGGVDVSSSTPATNKLSDVPVVVQEEGGGDAATYNSTASTTTPMALTPRFPSLGGLGTGESDISPLLAFLVYLHESAPSLGLVCPGDRWTSLLYYAHPRLSERVWICDAATQVTRKAIIFQSSEPVRSEGKNKKETDKKMQHVDLLARRWNFLPSVFFSGEKFERTEQFSVKVKPLTS